MNNKEICQFLVQYYGNPLGQNLHAVPSHEQIESLSREGYIKVEGYGGTEESLDNITVNITDKGREYYEKYCKL